MMAKIYKFAVDWSIEARDYDESMIYCKQKLNMYLPWQPNADLAFEDTIHQETEEEEEFDEESCNLSEEERKKEKKHLK